MNILNLDMQDDIWVLYFNLFKASGLGLIFGDITYYYGTDVLWDDCNSWDYLTKE